MAKGNPSSIRGLQGILQAFSELSDDSGILMQHAIITGVDSKWVENQMKVDNGIEFLKLYSDIFNKLAEANEKNETTQIDSLLKEFIVNTNKRWKEFRILYNRDEDKKQFT
jgi:flagellin-specific chaperone FliS